MKFVKTADGNFINADYIVELYISKSGTYYNGSDDREDIYHIGAVLRRDVVDDQTQLTRELKKYEFKYNAADYSSKDGLKELEDKRKEQEKQAQEYLEELLALLTK